MKNQKSICFIGAGNMTRAIIQGLVSHQYPASLICATNPSTKKLNDLASEFHINTSTDNLSAIDSEVIVLAVKPQMMAQVCDQLSQINLSEKLIISIAAGIPAKQYTKLLKQNIHLIRTMPNTPLQVGEGMTGLFADNKINQQDKTFCEQLMSFSGKTLWVNNEDELNLVIALAGSAPAYFYLFVESMVKAAQSMGMDQAAARELAQQAALGSSQMMIQNPNTPIATLRENVTSKGGTTAEALACFYESDLEKIVQQAMQRCIARAEQIAETF